MVTGLKAIQISNTLMSQYSNGNPNGYSINKHTDDETDFMV